MNAITIVSGLGLLGTIAWWLRGPYRSSAFVGLGMLGAVVTWSACAGWLPDWTANPGLVLMTGVVGACSARSLSSAKGRKSG